MTNPRDIAINLHNTVQALKEKPVKVVLTLGQAQTVRRFNAAKKAIKLAEARKSLYEAEIRGFLGDATKGVDDKGNTLVSVISHPGQKRANLAILETTFPEAYTATVSASPYTYVK